MPVSYPYQADTCISEMYVRNPTGNCAAGFHASASGVCGNAAIRDDSGRDDSGRDDSGGYDSDRDDFGGYGSSGDDSGWDDSGWNDSGWDDSG
jgi:hypothetical protein